VTTADLAEAMEPELGQEIDRRKIISDPLRQLGEHSVEVRLMTDVSATLKVIIESEEAEEMEVPEELRVPVEPEEILEAEIESAVEGEGPPEVEATADEAA